MNNVTSLEIAKIQKSNHKAILYCIRNIIDKNPEYNKYFILSTYKNRGKNYPMYLLDSEGLKIYLDNTRNTLNKKELYDMCNSKVVILQDRFEDEFFNKLSNALQPLCISGISQYCIDKYRIDYYIPSLNIAIEYDEKEHKRKQEQDRQREEYLKETLGDSFIRLDATQNDYFNIGIVMKEIIKRLLNFEERKT